MIKAGKFNVAPGHLFSGSKGNAIPGSRCRNPAALCSERCLAHSPSVMVTAEGSPTQTAVRERQELGLQKREQAVDSCGPNNHPLGKATGQVAAIGGAGGWGWERQEMQHFRFRVKAG